MPASARFGAGHPAKRSFQAIRIAVNGELEALERGAAAGLGACCRSAAASRAISFHSLEDRPVKQFLAAKARGCICPPELPVCVCGHEPEAELLTRRAVSPGPEEVEAQPALALGPPARGAEDRRGRSPWGRPADGRRRPQQPQPPRRPRRRGRAAAETRRRRRATRRAAARRAPPAKRRPRRNAPADARPAAS